MTRVTISSDVLIGLIVRAQQHVEGLAADYADSGHVLRPARRRQLVADTVMDLIAEGCTEPVLAQTATEAVTQAIAGAVHVASEAAEATAAVLLALAEPPAARHPLLGVDDLDPLGRGQDLTDDQIIEAVCVQMYTPTRWAEMTPALRRALRGRLVWSGTLALADPETARANWP